MRNPDVETLHCNTGVPTTRCFLFLRVMGWSASRGEQSELRKPAKKSVFETVGYTNTEAL